MSFDPSKYDSLKGKATRKKMINRLLADHGGKIKYAALEKYLKAQGYYFLMEKLETMGFFVINGYVRSSAG